MTIANKITFFSLLALFSINSVFAQSAARQTDATGGGGEVTQGSPTVLIEGRPAARVGDLIVTTRFVGPIHCVGGPIAIGSATVSTNTRPAARVGDFANTICGPEIITTGAPTVLIGD